MGKNVEEVLSSTNISAENHKKYSQVVTHFNGFFKA
jgi:hypothetical protein